MAVIEKINMEKLEDYATELSRHRRYKKDIKYILDTLDESDEATFNKILESFTKYTFDKMNNSIMNGFFRDDSYGGFAFVDQKTWDVEICVHLFNVDELVNELVRLCKDCEKEKETNE